MSLADIMLEQLAIARRIIEDGHEIVPAWRISAPEGSYLILTRFDPDKPEQLQRLLELISRFMTWKMATSFVVVAETWLGADRSGGEALSCVGVSQAERIGFVQRIRRDDVDVEFEATERLQPDQIDETYFKLLPAGASQITAEEAAELNAIFGDDGELPAQRLS